MALSTLLNHTNIVSTISGGIFAGAAAYISFSEVPALNKSGPNELWRFFPYMYSNAAKMQAPLAVISGTTGIIYSLRITDPLAGQVWLGAALCFVGIVPYTLFLMMPTNKRIIESNKTLEDEAEKTALLTKWSKLHLVRTVASVAGFSTMVYALVKYS
ncbi:hypothetical protein HA402_013038 [Bradysia odoriphaga]|nr:hypothetical protein HA402_013038 [Bradysia odoriphaga]